MMAQIPEVIVRGSPVDVVLIAEPVGPRGPQGPPGAVGTERTIAFASLDKTIKQTDNQGAIMCNAADGPLTGDDAIVMDTSVLVSPMLVLFTKVDSSTNQIDIVDQEGEIAAILSLEDQSPILLSLIGGKLQAVGSL